MVVSCRQLLVLGGFMRERRETLEVSENGGHRGKLGNLVDKIGARSLS